MSAFEKFKNQPWECDFRTHPKDAPLCGVFVESRDHPDIEYALRNFSCMLPYAALTIFHSKANYAKILKIVGEHTNIRFIELPDPFGRIEWITGCLNPEFWKNLCMFDKVIFFNIDSGIRHNSILKFLHYDFIGARWNHLPTGDPRVFQGNGGFSIRNPKLVKEIVSRFRYPREITHSTEDDAWVNHWMVQAYPSATRPTFQTCDEFSTESNDISGTMGFHDSERYTPGISSMYKLADGPLRPRLLTIISADVDGRDVTALVRLGVGPNGLRIFKETPLGPGKTLTIRTDSKTFSYMNGSNIFIE